MSIFLTAIFLGLVQDDMRADRENDRILSRMRSDGIRLCFSHDRGIEEVIRG